MNLTYEVKENGYVIFNNGIAWIEQEGFFPYQGATIEESAQKHVEALLSDAEKMEDYKQSFEDRLALAEEMLMEIMLNGVSDR